VREKNAGNKLLLSMSSQIRGDEVARSGDG
jgi:hypothetical protein